jgi:hypothetical protein
LLTVLVVFRGSEPANASQNAVCADATLTFSGTGTSVNYLPATPANVSINFGRTFNVADVKIVQIYIKFGPTDLVDGGEGWFMPNFGGQDIASGSISSSFSQVLDLSVRADFADGLFVSPLNAEPFPVGGPGPASFEVIAVRGCVIESVGPGQKTPTSTGTATAGPTNTSTVQPTSTATRTPTMTPTTVIVQPTSTPGGTVVAQGTNTPTRTPGPSLGGVAERPVLSPANHAEVIAIGGTAAAMLLVLALAKRRRVE